LYLKAIPFRAKDVFDERCLGADVEMALAPIPQSDSYVFSPVILKVRAVNGLFKQCGEKCVPLRKNSDVDSGTDKQHQTVSVGVGTQLLEQLLAVWAKR
jgi:hypothetical protein